jgi:hypothetical protein
MPTDREQDAIAAVKLHGWRWCDNLVVKGRFLHPPSEVASYGDKYAHTEPGDNPQQYRRDLPHYHTDASDDYRTLVVIRQRARDGDPLLDWEKYLDAIWDEWFENGEKLECYGIRTWERALGYVPGMYTQAALVVLESEEPHEAQ